ncbi:hypothetical protein LCGC14_1817450 [marine sediment metagenome]|uniref:Uncharacterized protein n=1 Tax=marine sediment metagenome TaxID=412755 RepID=A0A0F9JJF8_9ZZZZ
MAITPVVSSLVVHGVHKWVWTGLTQADTGAIVGPELGMGTFADKSIFMESPAAWGGGTIILEGSNDGVVFVGLNDPQGSPISFTVDAIVQILENPLYIRPRATAGAAMSVDITMAGRAIMQLR